MTTQYATATEFRALGLASSAVAGYVDADIDGFLQIASAIADADLRAQYLLPILDWGQDLRIAVIQIAVLLLLNHRGFDPQNAPASAITADKQAREWLSMVSTAQRTLQPPAPDYKSAQRNGAAVYSKLSRGW